MPQFERGGEKDKMEISKVEAVAKIMAIVVAVVTLTVPVFADSPQAQ